MTPINHKPAEIADMFPWVMVPLLLYTSVSMLLIHIFHTNIIYIILFKHSGNFIKIFIYSNSNSNTYQGKTVITNSSLHNDRHLHNVKPLRLSSAPQTLDNIC